MERICLICGSLECNCYLLVNESLGEAVLIDCGDDAGKIINSIQSRKVRLMGILLTHGHADHIASVEEVSSKFDCPIHLHREDEMLLKRALYNLSIQVLRRALTVNREVSLLNDGDHIQIAGYDFEVIHTPGHTNGSVCYRWNDCLFTGDTLFKDSVGGDFPPFGDLNKEICSIQSRLFTIDQDLICYPGHGESTSLYYEKKNNLYCRM